MSFIKWACVMIVEGIYKSHLSQRNITEASLTSISPHQFSICISISQKICHNSPMNDRNVKMYRSLSRNQAAQNEAVYTLSDILKLLITENNLTEAELARQVNLPQPTVHRLLTGGTCDPRASTLKTLANFFNISIDQLLGTQPLLRKHTHAISIPLISWQHALKWSRYIKELTPSNWKKWVSIQHDSPSCYALLSKAAMTPRFPQGTILIINPDLEPEDGDLVVIHQQSSAEATLREYFDDGLIKYLKPIIPDLQKEKLDKSKICLGVLIQSIFNYHE